MNKKIYAYQELAWHHSDCRDCWGAPRVGLLQNTWYSAFKASILYPEMMCSLMPHASGESVHNFLNLCLITFGKKNHFLQCPSFIFWGKIVRDNLSYLAWLAPYLMNKM